MYLFYNLVFILLFVLTFPYFYIRAVVGRHGVKQRLGFLPAGLHKISGPKPLVWIHASSVGEVKLIPILIETFLQRDSNLEFLVTTTTKTGQEEARKLLGKQVEFILYQPVDLPWVTSKVMRKIGPKALLLVETEFWPNLIGSAKKTGAVVGLINGRISSKSFSRYSLIKPLAREVLSQLDFLAVQTEKDLYRLNELGGQINKMKIVGSLKFDQQFLAVGRARKIDKKSLGLAESTRVMVAGSTRPVEEEIVLSVFRRLQKENHLSLILAPRHLDRIEEIELLLKQRSFNYLKKSELKEKAKNGFEVLLLDTMGELAEIYSAADLAFVGGSLVPLGGHNPLEPAVYGIPVLFGPYTEHSQAAADLLSNSGLGFRVKDEEEFFQRAQMILSNGLDIPKLVANFQKALRQNSGAAQKTADIFFSKFSVRPD